MSLIVRGHAQHRSENLIVHYDSMKALGLIVALCALLIAEDIHSGDQISVRDVELSCAVMSTVWGSGKSGRGKIPEARTLTRHTHQSCYYDT